MVPTENHTDTNMQHVDMPVFPLVDKSVDIPLLQVVVATPGQRGLILPGARRSLSHMRDSVVSVDEGSVINNYFFFNTAPTQCPEERNDTERLNVSDVYIYSTAKICRNHT